MKLFWKRTDMLLLLKRDEVSAINPKLTVLYVCVLILKATMQWQPRVKTWTFSPNVHHAVARVDFRNSNCNFL